MKRCPKCGERFADDARFCPACGTRIGAKQQDEQSSKQLQPRKKKKTISRLLILILCVLLIAILIAIMINAGIIGKKNKLQTYAPDTQQTEAPAIPDETGLHANNAQPAATDALTEMPLVIGLAEQDATQQLEKLGLTVQIDTPAYDAAQPEGVVLEQSVPKGTFVNYAEAVMLTVNRLPLALQAIWISPREGRLMMGNLLEICRMMDTTNPNYEFQVQILTKDDPYTLAGGFRCLTGPNEETPISRLNTKFYKGAQNLGKIESQLAGSDYVTWSIAIDDWTGFNAADIQGYSITITSKANPDLKMEKEFATEQTTGNTLLKASFEDGAVELEAESDKKMIIRLTDDQLLDHYSVSPAKGAGKPVWEIKVCEASYKWIDVVVDGSDCTDLQAMNMTTSQLYADKSVKGKAASQFGGAFYQVEDHTLVITVQIPEDTGHSMYAMQWLEISMRDGSLSQKFKIQ